LPGGAFDGARGDIRELRSWTPALGDAISDSSGDLPELRRRTRDLVRNAPVAAGAAQTTVMGVVGTGFSLHPRLDRQLLQLTEDEAAQWETRASWYLTMWAGSTSCDLQRRRTFPSLTRQFFGSAWVNGDAFAMRRHVVRPNDPFTLRLQLFEADRVGTPPEKSGDPRIVDGIELDVDGGIVAYHVANRHPYARYATQPLTYERVPAFGVTGDRLVLQLHGTAGEDRIGAVRGIPALATVIKRLKQIDRFSDAELARQVVSSLFTVFIKGAVGEGFAVEGDPTEAVAATLKDVKLGAGAVVGLRQNEEVEFATPPGPSGNFDPFTTAMLREIGTAINIPYEVLVRHFTASFSASRAAIQLAWRAFEMMGQWVEDDFLQPVYEWFITDCVAGGLLDAPGFFDDPLIRRAWCNIAIAGPRPPQIDPLKEATAAKVRMDAKISTMQREQADLGYGDYDDNLAQQIREASDRKRLGFTDPSSTQTSPAVGQPAPAAPVPADPSAEVPPPTEETALPAAQTPAAIDLRALTDAVVRLAMRETPAPQVVVHPPDVHVDIAATTIDVTVMPGQPMKREIVRNAQGLIEGSIDTPLPSTSEATA
jgi:lambda family phage portal protein